MPIYDFKCRACGEVFEKIVPSTITVVPHMHPVDPWYTGGIGLPTIADRLLSAPASIRMDSLKQIRKRAATIREPIWRYPDGHVEPVNP